MYKRQGKEYALEIVLKTKKHETVYYYTRIVYGVDYDLQKKLDFVMDFNACTFDDSRLKDIAGYLETSSSGDNTNYGKVNINCSLSQVGWGDLDPYVESDIMPEVISDVYKRQAMHNETKIIDEAKAEAARIIERANVEAELEKQKVADEVKQQIVTVAAVMASKLVARSIDEKDSNALIEETLNEMGEKTWLS